MINDILSLTCTECTKTKYNTYVASLLDSDGQKYILSIHDPIPPGKVISLNTFYHDLLEKEDVTVIRPVQKFKNNQPDKLEVHILDIKEIKDGLILTLKDTTTSEKFKLKVNSKGNVGRNMVLELKKLDMNIQCMPHYHNGYSIENWIFFK